MKILSSSAGLLAVLVIAPLSVHGPTPEEEGDRIVLGGRLWDGTGDSARPNPGILIRYGTIPRVGDQLARGGCSY